MKRYLFLILFLFYVYTAEAGTIHSYTEKNPPDDADEVVIYDSDDGSTKKVQVGNISGSGTGINWSSYPDLTALTSGQEFLINNAGTSSSINWEVVQTQLPSTGWTDGGTNIYTTTSTDTVGIGTPNPTAINGNYLVVLNSSSNTARTMAVYNSNAGTSAQSRFELKTADSNGEIIQSPTNASTSAWAGRTMLFGETGSGAAVGVATGDITFLTGSTAERMRVNSTGVGIGTSTPGSNLSVLGGVSLGSYATMAAPAGGLISSGNVGIGTTDTSAATLFVGTNAISSGSIPTRINLGSDFSTSAGQNLKLKVYDASGQDYGFGVSSGRMDYVVNATSDDHAFYGGTSLLMLIKGNGNVGIGTSTVTGKFQVLSPTAQTISAGGTITANACGTVKILNSASSVTTDTTNTFTTPTATQNGCCMRVVNTNASDTITLDTNANFVSNGAADVVLGSYDSAEVCSEGTKWFQLGSTGNN